MIAGIVYLLFPNKFGEVGMWKGMVRITVMLYKMLSLVLNLEKHESCSIHFL